ncbi:uncharacterized protein LOC135822914 [Sycon ciliatum]|uniref:uncharacterized protein LOC135822914 n=1 Tax=Sycon ciliatum TaxID=27933 RepID=UPI0031F5FC8E
MCWQQEVAAPRAAEPDPSPISKPTAAPRKPCPDPFESSTYITTLQPWIKKLDPTALAGKLQALDMLTRDQVTELDRIKKNDGGPAHNSRLLDIIHGEEIHGFVKLYKAILTITKNIDRLDQMKSLIPDEYLSPEYAAFSASMKAATYRGSATSDLHSIPIPADSRSMDTADHVDKHVSTPTEEYAARQDNWSADTHTQVKESQAEHGRAQLSVQALKQRQNMLQASKQMVVDEFEQSTWALEILERLEYPEQLERKQIPLSLGAEKMLDSWTRLEAISVKSTVDHANILLQLMSMQVKNCHPAIRDQVTAELKESLAHWQETGLELKSNVSKDLIKQLFLALDGKQPTLVSQP